MWQESYHFRPKSRKRRATFFRRLLILVLVTTLALLLWRSTKTITPHTALAQAVKLAQTTEPLTPEQLDDAERFLEIASRHSSLSQWVLLIRAQLYEKFGRIDDANRAYSEIASSHPASFDAELARYRLALTHPSISMQGEAKLEHSSLEDLERRLYDLGREDLIPELIFVRARFSENSGDTRAALSLYHQLRRSYPKHPLVLLARTSSERLLSLLEQQPGEAAFKVVLDELSVLVSEGKADEALEEATKLETLIGADNPAIYQLLLVKESALRKLRRGEEGDDLLIRIGGNGTLGTADVALLRSAKNSWNINDHHRALEFIDRLHKRFPNTPLKMESKYIEARILEEMSSLSGASEKYAALGASELPALDRLRALKRLAWLLITNGDFSGGAEAFDKARLLALTNTEALRNELADLSDYQLNQPLNGSKAKDFNELLEELAHATYWERYALNQLSGAERARLKLPSNTERVLESALAELPENSYYRLLSTSPSDLHSPGAAQPTNQRDESEERCAIQSVEGLPEDMDLYQGIPEIEPFARATINWSLRDLQLRLGEGPIENRRYARFKSVTTRVALFHRYVSPRPTIELAERGLRQIARLPELTPQLKRCQAELLELAYPMPYKNLFISSAQKSNIEPTLLLAIARTESFFDPRAESIVGAKGMAQLMPATAKQEGWNGNHSLYDPKLNLELGAKHLKRLIGEFGDPLPYSIAAYNAGSSPVNRWRSRYEKLPVPMWTELIGYPETHKYVKRVLVAREIYSKSLK